METLTSDRAGSDLPGNTICGWTELASRASSGLAVSLQWSRSTGRLKVEVVDARSHEQFELEVARADALAAFHHPFAWRAALRFSGDALTEPIIRRPRA
jgi:hypothetical protein